jgi:hypothetical protein
LYYFYNGIGGGLLYILFIIAEVGNLDKYLDVALVYFDNDKGG